MRTISGTQKYSTPGCRHPGSLIWSAPSNNRWPARRAGTCHCVVILQSTHQLTTAGVTNLTPGSDGTLGGRRCRTHHLPGNQPGNREWVQPYRRRACLSAKGSIFLRCARAGTGCSGTQVDPYVKANIETRFSLVGSMVETGWFQAMGRLHSTCTAPTRVWSGRWS
jgi:hypothetical protein